MTALRRDRLARMSVTWLSRVERRRPCAWVKKLWRRIRR
jgi:hypothetical protein